MGPSADTQYVVLKRWWYVAFWSCRERYFMSFPLALSCGLDGA